MDYQPRRPGEGILDGPWRVHPLGDELRRIGADEDLDDGDWMVLDVPGHWGEHPELANHNGPLLYRRRFGHRRPEGDERLWLRFDGVMASAEVWLDGAYVGDTVGYFASHRTEVTAMARERDEHVLAVEVSCPPSGETNRTSLTGSLQSGPLAPPGNPGGIWQPVAIDSTGPVAVRHARLLCLEASDDRAQVRLRLVLDAAAGTEVQLQTTVSGPNGETAGGGTQRQVLASGENRIEWTTEIDQPELWWPASLGQQPLYDVDVSVNVQANGTWLASDRRQWRTGLRTITTDDFIWRVNGQRLFVKGIAAGPAAKFLRQASDEQLADDVQTTLGAGFDMLRVSAHIAPEALYREADRAGLLIWQDLPLIGSASSRIRPQVQHLVRAAVDQLGHHPSIGIWCGHSEPGGRPRDVMQVPNRPDPPDGPTRSRDRTRIGRRVVAGLLPGWNRIVLGPLLTQEFRDADPTRRVVARSGVLPGPEEPSAGDAQLWLGWRAGSARDLPIVLRRWPRLAAFLGGIGTQSANRPIPVESAFAPVEDSDSTPWPTAEWGALMRSVPRAAYADDNAWMEATQTHQAEVLRTHIETLRRLKYQPAGGFCLSALRDPEPAGGFGILDVDRRPKACFEVVVDACRPVAVIADQPPTVVTPGQSVALEVHAVSDLPLPLDQVRVTARARWEQPEPQGGQKGPTQDRSWQETTSWEGSLDADACNRIGRFSFEVPAGHGPLVVDFELISDQLVATNRYRTVVIPSSEALDEARGPRSSRSGDRREM